MKVMTLVNHTINAEGLRYKDEDGTRKLRNEGRGPP